MQLSRTFLFALLASMHHASSVAAFVQPRVTTGVALSPMSKTSSLKPSFPFAPSDMNNPRRSTSLSAMGIISTLREAPITMEGLTFGWIVICAAMTPYVFQLFSPTGLNFFLANYYGGQDIDELRAEGVEDDEIERLVEAGRVAEIKWKVRFAALGLAVSTIAFFEVYGDVDAAHVLRDSYIAWGIFYIESTRLIRKQAVEEKILKRESRFWIQVWHSLVTILLWASISETYTGNGIRAFVTDVFTFN